LLRGPISDEIVLCSRVGRHPPPPPTIASLRSELPGKAIVFIGYLLEAVVDHIDLSDRSLVALDLEPRFDLVRV
jgi:hypothetical protein